MSWETIKAKIHGARKSITIWFNGVALTLVPFIDQAKDLVPQLEQYLDDHLFKKLMLGVIIAGNLLLRFKTNSDLQDK